MNLVLVGYRGSGKSTVGPLLAKLLQYKYVDLDSRIADSAGQSIRQIFQTEGEAGFRKLEAAALRALGKLDRHVIAVGGGILDDAENRPVIKRLGRVVWLQAPAVVLRSRIAQDGGSHANRPDLTSAGSLDEVESVLARREPIYRQAANHVVETVSSSPAGVAEAIELWFRANDSDSE